MGTFAASGGKQQTGMASLARSMAAVERSIQRDKENAARSLPKLEAEHASILQKLSRLEKTLDKLLAREDLLIGRQESAHPGSARTQRKRRQELREINQKYEEKETSFEELKSQLQSLVGSIDRARKAKQELERHPPLASDTSSDELIS